jgi:hypothetical protein
MTCPEPHDIIGPGHPRQAYLDILTAGGDTGWYDEHGVPAPWPDDFCDPDSRWHPTGGDATTINPDQPF